MYLSLKFLVRVFAALAMMSTASGQVFIFESAAAGGGGDSGVTIGGSAGQIYGAAFTISGSVHVDAIGGLLFGQSSPSAGDIFGAIVSLSSIDAVPAGDPFTGPEVVASTVFHVGNTTAAEVTTPLSVDLAAGAYALVFGNGQFGATGVAGATPAGAILTTHYLVWTTSVDWGTGTGYSRFFVTGVAIPEPSASVALFGASCAGLVLFRGVRRCLSGPGSRRTRVRAPAC